MSSPQLLLKNRVTNASLLSEDLISTDVSIDASYIAVCYLESSNNEILIDVYSFNDASSNYNTYHSTIKPEKSLYTNMASEINYSRVKIIETTPDLKILFYSNTYNNNVYDYIYTTYKYESEDESEDYIKLSYFNYPTMPSGDAITLNNVYYDGQTDYILCNFYPFANKVSIRGINSNTNSNTTINITPPPAHTAIIDESISFSNTGNRVAYFTQDGSNNTTLFVYDLSGNNSTLATMPIDDMSGAIVSMRTSLDLNKIIIVTYGNESFGTFPSSNESNYRERAYEIYKDVISWKVREITTMATNTNIIDYLYANQSQTTNFFGVSPLGNRVVYMSYINDPGFLYRYVSLNYLNFNKGWANNTISNSNQTFKELFDSTSQLDTFVVRTRGEKTVIITFYILDQNSNNYVNSYVHVLDSAETEQSPFTSEIFINASVNTNVGVSSFIREAQTDSIYVYEYDSFSVPPPQYYARFDMNPSTISSKITYTSDGSLNNLIQNITSANTSDNHFSLDTSFNGVTTAGFTSDQHSPPQEQILFTKIYWNDAPKTSITTLPDFISQSATNFGVSAQAVSITSTVENETIYNHDATYDSRVKLPFEMVGASTKRVYQIDPPTPIDDDKTLVITNSSTPPSLALNNVLQYETTTISDEIGTLDCSGRLQSISISTQRLNKILFTLIYDYKINNNNPDTLTLDTVKTLFDNNITGIVSDISNIPLTFYVGTSLSNPNNNQSADFAPVGLTHETQPSIQDQSITDETGIVVDRKLFTWIVFDKTITAPSQQIITGGDPIA